MSDIEVLPEYLLALEHVKSGTPLILVTGGAGTGKSTFIRWLQASLDGSCLLAAPTGVAAQSIGGKTLHSLCSFPPAWIMEDDVKRVSKSPVSLAQVLIIDEISMVNANLLDGVDAFLRVNRKSDRPFGGICVVLVGDLFQLPPVVTAETAPLFNQEYSSARFFAARALRNCTFEVIELTRAFRQHDQAFVDLLGKIREGKSLNQALVHLNLQARVTESPPSGSVWLCPRHVEIDEVNARKMAMLPGASVSYTATVTGTFRESQQPVPQRLELKVGAQVVLAKNSEHWVNGSVGIVQDLDEDHVSVRILKTGKVYPVFAEVWEQFDYRINAESGQVERVVVGMFRQMPLMLAWALTIHKSQGLTLDAVHLDLGRGAFDFGQTYVALSRCRTMERLSLSRPLRLDDVRVDPEATAFYEVIRR